MKHLKKNPVLIKKSFCYLMSDGGSYGEGPRENPQSVAKKVLNQARWNLEAISDEDLHDFFKAEGVTLVPGKAAESKKYLTNCIARIEAAIDDDSIPAVIDFLVENIGNIEAVIQRIIHVQVTIERVENALRMSLNPGNNRFGELLNKSLEAESRAQKY